MSFPNPSERLFVGIGFPEPCRAALAELMQPIDGVRWTRPEQLHLTLRFLGDVLDDQIQKIVESLSKVRVEPFLLPLEGIGAFPPRGHPKILWAGLGRAHTRLFQLRQRVDDALLAAGWRGEMRSFDPHVTVGRVVTASVQSTDEWLHEHRDFEGPPFRVETFQLVASELHSSGPVHRVHTEFRLDGAT